MEVRKSKTLNPPRPVDVLFLVFLLQFWPATAQTLDPHNYRISSLASPVKSPSSGEAGAAKSPPLNPSRFNQTQGRRVRRPNRTTVEFLNAHNLVRRRVAEPMLEWDGKLEAYARAWAKKRVNDCRLVHSEGPFGENIFWGGRNHWRAREVVKIWADEHKYYDEKANRCEPNQMCGHYTQIVWRESTKVGCAREDCSNGGVYVICVYNPPGNYEGENPFGQYTDQTNVVRKDPPATVALPPNAPIS